MRAALVDQPAANPPEGRESAGMDEFTPACQRSASAQSLADASTPTAFLVKHVFGISEFTIEDFTHARGSRRPPTIMTRDDVHNVIGYLENP